MPAPHVIIGDISSNKIPKRFHRTASTGHDQPLFSARRICAGIIRQLEAAEKEKGITPDPQVAELHTRLHNLNDPGANVALVLQARTLLPVLYGFPFAKG